MLTTRIRLAGITAMFLLASCGGGDGGNPADSVPDAADEVSFGQSSPIGAFFAGASGQQAAMSDFQRRAQELMRQCMLEEGFEFFVDVPPVPESEAVRYELTEREWTQRFGYGISTTFESIVAMQGADPNTQLVVAMSPEEQEAWQVALLGGALGRGEVTDPADVPPVEEQGCSGAAVVELGGQDAAEGIGEFSTAYGEQFEAMFNSPEMVAASDSWSGCMSERGWDFGSQEDAYAYVTDALDSATASLAAELENFDRDQLAALFEGSSIDPDNLPGFDRVELEAAQVEEIEIALTISIVTGNTWRWCSNRCETRSRMT
jgi:hypothetical protein